MEWTDGWPIAMSLDRRQVPLRRKAAAVIGFGLLTIAGSVAFALPAANGYEISIYETFPLYFWGAVVGALVVGLGLILAGAFDADADDRYWQLGFLLVLLTHAFLLLLPYVRGYPVYGRGDVLTHVGYVKSIVDTAAIGSIDVYPNIHLFTFTLSAATGLEILRVINVVAPVFTLVSLAAFYLLLTKIVDDRRAVLFGAAFVLLLVGTTAHVNPSPFAQSSLLVPFVLYVFFREQRSNSIAIRVVFAVAIISMVLYHPLTTLFLLFVFAVYVVAKRVFRGDTWPANPTNAVEITAAVFVTWYINFAGIINRFESVYESLLTESSGSSQIATYSSTVERTSPALVDLLRIALFKYGVSAILLAFGSMYVIVAGYLYRRDRLGENRFVLATVGSFVVFVIFAIVFLLNDFPGGFGRPLMYTRLFGVVLTGLFFYTLWRVISDQRLRRGIQLGVYVTVGVLVLVSTFSLYYSPLMSNANMQVTEMELDGTEWLFQHDEDAYEIEQFGIEQRRFHDVHYGKRTASPIIRYEETVPPPHFNYTTHQTLGQSYSDDRYFMVTRLGRITYEKKFPDYEEFWRYTPDDYERLEYDPTVHRIYSNGEFETYFIDGTA